MIFFFVPKNAFLGKIQKIFPTMSRHPGRNDRKSLNSNSAWSLKHWTYVTDATADTHNSWGLFFVPVVVGQ